MLQARSISTALEALLSTPLLEGRVLSVHERACNLILQADCLLSLVVPPLRNGPRHIVLEAFPGCFAPLRPGDDASIASPRLRAGSLEVSLTGADSFHPSPDWRHLSRRSPPAASLEKLITMSRSHAPSQSLLMLLLDELLERRPKTNTLSPSYQARALKGAQILREGWPHDVPRLQEAARTLAGLGPGLTPAGDDFLSGVMLAAHASLVESKTTCEGLLEASLPQTGTLSRAFLRDATQGQCGEAWHALLKALYSPDGDALEAAVLAVLSMGATSGADMLAGFLWIVADKWSQEAS